MATTERPTRRRRTAPARRPPTKRSYEQFCPAARALDLIGERWTLLIVRELLFAPKRFSEIEAGLPGVAPNILSGRLKELQQGGLIERRRLGTDGAWAYELTELGAGLRPLMRELYRWGAQFLERPRPHDRVGLEWILNWMRVGFNPNPPGNVTGSCEFRIGDQALHVIIGGDGAVAVEGPAPQPDAVVILDLATFTAVSTGQLSVREAEQRAHVIGDLELARRASLTSQLARATPADPDSRRRGART